MAAEASAEYFSWFSSGQGGEVRLILRALWRQEGLKQIFRILQARIDKD
jgi:nitrous oxide reductase